MSDTSRDATDHGHDVARLDRNSVLYQRLRRFADEHEPPDDLETMRASVSGASMSSAIVEERTDRV